MSDKVFIQFGAGQLHLPAPWRNYDRDADCSKPLDRGLFPDASADIIFSEMMVEHLTPQQGWNFLDECYRILKPGGVLRIVIPDFVKNWRDMNEAYRRVNGGVTGAVTDKDHARSIIFGHGHQSMWTSPMMECVLEAIGFKNTVSLPMSFSNHDALREVEQHWRSVGKDCAAVESGCVEGTKP
jgi:predicted SAM-dependent methyltransferase